MNKPKTKFNASMFDTLKDTLKKESSSNGSFSNVMKFPQGHVYTIRFIPNLENIAETFFHHYTNQWTSKSTDKFVSAISLQTFGERDPINDVRWKLYKAWKDSPASKVMDDKGKPVKFDSPIQQKEQWYANIYVVEDPSDSENNGKVKILKMGPQLMDIFKEAFEGERSDEFGAAIFDLSSDGADFKIKADKKGEYTTFEKSFFKAKSVLDLDEEEIDAVYENLHDLKQIQPVRTYEELETLLQEHFFVEDESDDKSSKEERKPLAKKVEREKEVVKKTEKKVEKKEEPEDAIPMSFDNDSLDEDIDELLAGLDD